MATIPAATAITPDGVRIDTPATAATSSMTFANNGAVGLLVKNGSGGSINVTFTSPKTVPDGGGTPLAVADRIVAVPDGQEYLIGPFPQSVYNDTNNEVTVAFSSTTTVTVQAVSFVPAAT
jgi:hypothetical protein